MIQGTWNQWVPCRGPRYKLGMVTQESQENLAFKTSLGYTVRFSLKKESREMAHLAAKLGDQHHGRRELTFTSCPLPSTGTLWHNPSQINVKICFERREVETWLWS